MNNTNTETGQPLTSAASEPSTDYSDISFLEVPLQEDAFLETVDRTGRSVVYLRELNEPVSTPSAACGWLNAAFTGLSGATLC